MYTIENVDLSSWVDMNYYMDTIYLTPSEETVYVGGTITDASSGEELEDVTVKFRSGPDNQDGDYVQTVAGIDIELTTDESGHYYTAALPAGEYTLEASKDGYETAYLNVVSGSSEEYADQNLALSATGAYIDGFSGHHYEVIEDESITTWEGAKAYCESLGGYLAIITSQEENDYLYQLMVDSGYKSAYFGLTDAEEEGVWLWVDGSVPEYTNWYSGEPNNEGQIENYGMFYYKFTNGAWNDGDFAGGVTVNGGTAFICEWDS